jgi:hypothetical protein
MRRATLTPPATERYDGQRENLADKPAGCIARALDKVQ